MSFLSKEVNKILCESMCVCERDRHRDRERLREKREERKGRRQKICTEMSKEV